MTFRTVFDWNRRAPVALTGNAPIAQAVVGFDFTTAKFGQFSGDGIKSLLKAEPIKLTRIHYRAVFGISCFRNIGGLAAFVGDNRFDGDAVLGGKLPVALVVAGYRHHRTGTKLHQHEVSHVNGHFITG